MSITIPQLQDNLNVCVVDVSFRNTAEYSRYAAVYLRARYACVDRAVVLKDEGKPTIFFFSFDRVYTGEHAKAALSIVSSIARAPRESDREPMLFSVGD